VTAYASGNRYERRTVELLRSEGYHCWQSRGSRGPADVIAIKPRQLVLVQVKSGAKAISGAEWNALWRLACEVAAVPVLAEWRPVNPDKPGLGLAVTMHQLTGPHVAHKRAWPCTPFVTDQIAHALAKGTTTDG